MDDKNESYYLSNDYVLRKSNALIGAKYKTNLLENQLLSIAMTRIEADARTPDAPIKARLYPGDINRLIDKGKNIYRELRLAAKTLASHAVTIEDGKGNFKVFAFITDVTYNNKVLEITFSENIRPHILGLQNNFTTLNLSILTGFEKNASFRIYEILKKEMYKSRKSVNEGKVVVSYNVNEFRFMIGLANSEEAGVQKYLAKQKGAIDWDYLYEHVAIEKSYGVWQDFKKRILIPAQEELAASSDICFEYEGIRQGHKIKRIKFEIYPNVVSQEVRQMRERRARIIEEDASDMYRQATMLEYRFADLYDELVGHNGITADDVEFLLDRAGYDEEVVRTAVQMADKQPEIHNYMGWIRKCIEDGYAQPIEVIAGSSDTADTVNSIKNEIHSDSVKQGAWERIMQREDYEDFLKSTGYTRTQFEVIYDNPEEKLNMYVEWKLKN